MTMTDGQLEQANEHWQVRYVRSLPHPPEKVWRALTEPEHMEAWFPCRIVGEWEVGAPLRFEFKRAGVDPIVGEVFTYNPPKQLEFTWGDELLQFELEPDGDGCVLTLVAAIHELGKAARDGAGWHACLDNLAYSLDGKQPPWDTASDERWAQVHPGYVKRFGPEASTIGPPEG